MLLFAVAFALIVGCDEEKKELSDVAIIIKPTQSDTVTLSSGDKVRYTIDLHTTHQRVGRLAISSFDPVRGKVHIVDTLFNSKVSTYYFDYTAPAVNRDSLSVTLTFEAWDDQNNQCSTTRTLLVRNASHLIDEKTGIVLRAAESGMPDALSFANPSQTFSWKNSPDSVRADVYLVADASFARLSLHSNTKAKLVRINSFDYPAATAVSVQAVYESSLRSDWVDDLRTNDIILVGHEARAEGVLRIVNIIREGDSNERCLQLAFKGIN
jgi:hypothetical protein